MEPLYSAPYIEDEKLAGFAAAAAKLLRVEGEGSARLSVKALRRDLAAVRQCHEAVHRRYGELPSPPSACEWLLDNRYLAEREGRAALAALRRERGLRYVNHEPLILALARSLLNAGHGSVSAERCRRYLDGFQSVTVLRQKELRLFPAALRAAALSALAEVCRALPYAADTAEHAKAFEALFTTLRLLGVLDLETLLDEADRTGAVLASERAGVYAAMDRGTRRAYLEKLEKLARRSGVEEHLCARRMVRQADEQGEHVGFLLFPQEERPAAGLYIAANVLLTLFVSLLGGFLLRSAAAGLLLLLPVSELIKTLLDALLLHFFPPQRLPRMDLETGVPEAGRTVCVLSALLTDEESGARLAGKLEQLRLAHRSAGAALSFGLLADLPAADSAEMETDEALLQGARTAIRLLNRRYGGGFYLFTRARSFDGERWSAPERKRGALLELAKLLCDAPSKLSVEGERDALIGAHYILTLDSDTLPYPGSLTALIAAMLHPLNAPRLDGKSGRVIRGHAVIQPRLSATLRSAAETDFALLHAGPGGSDPYGSLGGDVYMNAFGSGGFAGKGILDARALLRCTEGLPAGRVLSHDALEGAFLRGALLGDTEFADAFPASPLSYYRRQHRWIRGDWQNAPWLFRRGRGLPAIERWRLFDSLRRSLLPIGVLAALLSGLLLPGRAFTAAALVSLLALSAPMLAGLCRWLGRKPGSVPPRRFTSLPGGPGGALLRSLVRLWLLPWEAWVCLSAVLTALWRMAVSGKKLLEWETAAQSEQRRRGASAWLRALWSAMLTGLGCLLLAPLVAGKAAGLLWLVSPLAAWALSLPAQSENRLSRADADYLRERAAEIWRYFAEFSTEREHFLPPDNVQQEPPVGPAHRVSPTNAGLAAASAAAACDLEIISAQEALGYLTRLCGTLERLPRCLGHFYNWYDTRTLLPLHPASVSTVDSGNLCAGLTVAARFADEQGDAALAARFAALCAGMDFAPLYDRARGLFHISYDAARGRGSGGWYDLLASEERLTSYLAIARGDVPVRHWRRLSRAQLQFRGCRGLASWSGTMFEYLMPELFLPPQPGSLLDESSRFCLYAQRRLVPPGKPWGVSESAYFSLDSRLNYRYKAHGCPALALRREREDDLVVSPYSAFLALSVNAAEAVRDLRRFERCGMLGRWGFFEALDLTPGRSRDDAGERVKCVMAHHAGMSLLAAANALCGGSIRRRFMSEPAMAAYELLLQERLPEESAVLTRRDVSREKPRRPEAGRWARRGGTDESGATLLSNGSWSLYLTSRGESRACLGEVLIYRESPGLYLNRRALLPARCSSWELGEDAAVYASGDETLEARVTLAAGSGDSGETRTIRLVSPCAARVELVFCLEPVLAREEDWRSHPAFWRLGLQAEERGDALLLKRLPRGIMPALSLALACDRRVRWTADRNGALGFLAQPFVTARLSLRLTAGETTELRFALCAAAEPEEALAGAQRLLRSGECERGSMLSAAATLLGLSAGEIGAAMALLPALRNPALAEAAPRRELWPWTISGELPILCCEGDAAESEKLLPRYLLLKALGQESDLVYLTDELGDYRQPLRQRVTRLLEKHGLEALLGVSGGVHFVPREAAAALESRAAWMPGRDKKTRPALPRPMLSAPRRVGQAPRRRFVGRAFEFEAGDALPPRPWQQVLTNGALSYLATDCGSGNLWLENARELPLDPPPALPEDTAGAEALWVETEAGPVSLFAANDGHPCRVSFSPGLAVWEKELEGGRRVKTSAYIARDVNVRVLLIEGAEGLRLGWRMALHHYAPDRSPVRCAREGDQLRAENPEAAFPGLVFRAGSSCEALLQHDFIPAGFLFRLGAEHLTALCCGCCGTEELQRLCRVNTALSELGAAVRRWTALTDRLEVSTGRSAIDHFLGGWGVYQTVACRLYARGSLYQRGGAYGFRDQLQDAVNLLLLDPSCARAQIERCCRHQYVEGDVMHWWHELPAGDRGLRSRCSDDLLWLSWALCETYEATCDRDFCLTELPYITSPPLGEDERDRYETAQQSEAAASVLDHARAALERCVSRGFGPHGLPRMLAGDWNDGMDEAGGESVWLGWFFSLCALRFAGLLETLGRPGAERFRELARRVGEAAEKSFLPGGWYARGYWPDGTVLGGEERLDSLAQSFAALSPFADPAHAASALDKALRRLVDREHGLVRLFDPPYRADERQPGYLVSYGEGFRENGGQYTHGAVWLALACFRLGREKEGLELMELLLPEKKDTARYGGEPYVLAADVSAAPGHEGEAGWTWYTGSSGWAFRVLTREILGLQRRGGRIEVSPRSALPDGCRVRLDGEQLLPAP